MGGYSSFSPIVEAEGMDRRDLLLPGLQLNLVQAVARRTATPIVVVLVHGAPLDVGWLQASPRVSSILSIWTPAQVGRLSALCWRPRPGRRNSCLLMAGKHKLLPLWRRAGRRGRGGCAVWRRVPLGAPASLLPIQQLHPAV